MGHTIYLADDEKSIRELLHSFLTSDGYTVRSFESGDALLEAFRQEPAELVILDIMMPGTDGLAVCRELRSVDVYKRQITFSVKCLSTMVCWVQVRMQISSIWLLAIRLI